MKTVNQLFVDELAGTNDAENRLRRVLPISGAQKIEHSRIESYGCLAEWADHLGNDEAAELLDPSRGEEQAVARTLTGMARLRCNECRAGRRFWRRRRPPNHRQRPFHRPARGRAKAW
jgi:ferritin-like metal-binding protein YciE